MKDERVKKVFISLPMAGYSTEEIKRRQAELFAQFVRETHLTNYRLIDTVTGFGEVRNDRDALRSLSYALGLLSDADALYFSDGAADARGCRIEREAARAYGIPVYHQGGGV